MRVTVCEFLFGGFTDLFDGDVEAQYLAGKRVVAVDDDSDRKSVV